MSNKYDIEVKQGSDKQITIIVKSDGETPDNLTNYGARMQVRQRPTDKTVLDELTSDNDRIEITPLEGKLVLKFPSSVSSNYFFKEAVYDLELFTGTPEVVTRLIQGGFSVDVEVTR